MSITSKFISILLVVTVSLAWFYRPDWFNWSNRTEVINHVSPVVEDRAAMLELPLLDSYPEVDNDVVDSVASLKQEIVQYQTVIECYTKPEGCEYPLDQLEYALYQLGAYADTAQNFVGLTKVEQLAISEWLGQLLK